MVGVDPSATCSARAATVDDLASVLAIDAVAFPSGAPDRKGAEPGELERGIAHGRVLLCIQEDEPIGFLHYERIQDNLVILQALGVRPDHRRQGAAQTLLTAFRQLPIATDDNPTFACVTSPGNVPMQRVLFRNGFTAKRYFDNYYGEGEDRLWFSRLAQPVRPLSDPELFHLPHGASGAVRDVLRRDGQVLLNLVRMDEGWAYVIGRNADEDEASLVSAESSGGVAFSSAVLAVLTFLLAFAFGSANYPESVRFVLVGAVVGTLLSLVLYANAQGEVSRLRSEQPSTYIKWGNAISEYWGVYPFIIVLPAVLAHVSGSPIWPTLVGLALSIGLFVYDGSRVSISRRYPATGWFFVARILTSLLPLAGAISHLTVQSEILSATQSAWAAAALGVLGLRLVLIRLKNEAG